MFKHATRIFILLILQIIFVQCIIPSYQKSKRPPSVLSVNKLDKKIIQRKRMDTFEMCRLFENERQKRKRLIRSRRSKREIGEPKSGGAPNLREEDVKRVESIVDKLYDDLSEKNGKRVTYRHREITTTTKVKKLNEALFNSSGRRFDFAPAVLLGPEKSQGAHQPPETVPGIPWIKKWKHGIIPYFIDPKTYDSGLAEKIMSAFDYIEKSTCIRLQRLREKPIDKESMEKVEWVYISNPMGITQCVHSNEQIPNKGVQMVVFGYDCMSRGEIAHEVMHVLGFSHEHNRPDRDNHVSIMWDNIKPGYKKYFELRSEDPLMRLPYDYASVLHYPPRAFSKNGKVTVLAKAGVKLGQREGLSVSDVEKVTLIFGNECVERNKDYLLTTCPSVVRTKGAKSRVANPSEINHYFKERIWPHGIVSYKLKDAMEFSAEEKENIQAVIRHIESETCIMFRDVSADKEEHEESKENIEQEDDEHDGREPDEENQDTDHGLNGADKGNFGIEELKYNENQDNEVQGLHDADSDKEKDGPTIPPKDEDNVIIPAGSGIDEPIDKNDVIDKMAKGEEKESPDSLKEFIKPGEYKENNWLKGAGEKQEDENVNGLQKAPDEKEEAGLQSVDEKPEAENPNEILAAEDDKQEVENENVLQAPADENGPLAANENQKEENENELQVENEQQEAGNDNGLATVISLEKDSNNADTAAAGRRRRSKRDANSELLYMKGKSKQNVKKSLRRHASVVIVFERSSEPGCKCPEPGKPSSDMVIQLNADCFNSVNDLLHVFVHILGLDHQHNMHDRDDFLHIVWDKLTPEMKDEMEKKLPSAAAMGFSYDYQSVMHYPWLQIKNGVTNIMYPIWNDGWAMGRWQGLSTTDVQKLSQLYFEQCLERMKFEKADDYSDDEFKENEGE